MKITRPNSTRGSIRAAAERPGAAATEFAIVIPLFALMLLGMIEFGRGIMVGQIVTNVAREAARQAIIDGSTNADVESAAIAKLEQQLGINASGAGIVVEITVGGGGGDVSSAATRDLCTVSVSVPYESTKYTSLSFLAGSSFVGTASMRHE
ncbi:MAG: TadE/TadG family type IV pilus assembly protein [Planctomycetota bacterium]|nr:TadE/TadG family type IV pilus assembly protein [Planctomycetota bacterium]